MCYEKWWVIIPYSLSSLHSWLSGCIIAFSVISLLRWKSPRHIISPCIKIVRNPRPCFPHFPPPSWFDYIHFDSTGSEVPSGRGMGEHDGSPCNDTLRCALHSFPKHASHYTHCLRFAENYPGWLHHLLPYSWSLNSWRYSRLPPLLVNPARISPELHLPFYYPDTRFCIFLLQQSSQTFLLLTTLKNPLSPVTFSASLVTHF